MYELYHGRYNIIIKNNYKFMIYKAYVFYTYD